MLESVLKLWKKQQYLDILKPMEPQLFKERMLEIENLTDELEDSEAEWLLRWGSEQLDRLLKDVDDPEAAGNKANALFAVMRKINRMSTYALDGARAGKAEDEVAADFMELARLTGEAFNRTPNLTPAEAQSAATHLPGLKPDIAVEFLARWALIACDLL